jgi:hypothetical protein
LMKLRGILTGVPVEVERQRQPEDRSDPQ